MSTIYVVCGKEDYGPHTLLQAFTDLNKAREMQQALQTWKQAKPRYSKRNFEAFEKLKEEWVQKYPCSNDPEGCPTSVSWVYGDCDEYLIVEVALV